MGVDKFVSASTHYLLRYAFPRGSVGTREILTTLSREGGDHNFGRFDPELTVYLK
jgi:hypothetical protein